MSAMVIGIDHGNGNVKTEHTVFPCGVKFQETEPNKLFSNDILEVSSNEFYTLSPHRLPYQTDKTMNEQAYIFTLFAVAKEIIARAATNKPNFDVHRDFTGFVGKDVILAIGLPPAHFEKQGQAFKEYFMKHAEKGIRYKFNDKLFHFYLKDVYVYPQDYAAAIVYKGEMIEKYSTCYCVDIGDGTVDMVGLTDGIPAKETILSREFGMSKLRSNIIDDVINDYGVTLDASVVEDFLVGKEIALAPDLANQIKARIDKTAEAYAVNLVNLLHTKVPDFRTFPTIFCGGGALALKPYLEKTKAFGITEYIEDIHANAIGYQELTKLQLGMN